MGKKRYIVIEDGDDGAGAAAGCLLVFAVLVVLAFIAVMFLMALPYVAALAAAAVAYAVISATMNEDDASGGAAALAIITAIIAGALSFYVAKSFSDNILLGWGSKLPIDPNPSALQGYLVKAKFGNGSLTSMNSLSECSHSYDPLHGILGIGRNRESYACSKGSYVFKYNTGRTLQCSLKRASIEETSDDKFIFTLQPIEGTCKRVGPP